MIETFNLVNAAFMAFMTLMTIFSPQEFMKGGITNVPWFKNIPEDKRNRVFYNAVFMAIIGFCGLFVPALFAPASRLLCLQNTVLQGAFVLHSISLLGTNAYKSILPDAYTKSWFQWVFMTLLGVGFTAWGIVVNNNQQSYAQDDFVRTKFNGVLTLRTANIVGIVFSSIFAFQFILMPKRLLSMFWSDDNANDANNQKTFMTFPILQNVYAGELFWARNSGIIILVLNVCTLFATDGFSTGLDSPLATIQYLFVTSTLNIFNINQLMMAPYGNKSKKNIVVSWIPTTLLCGGSIVISALALRR